MTKQKALLNFLSIIISLLYILINSSFSFAIETRIVMYLSYFILNLVISILRMNGIRNSIFNSEFIYGCVFFIYSLVGPIIFVLDNYSPRYYYFEFNTNTMNEALKIYFNIYCIYNILCFLFNKIEIYDMKSKIDILKQKSIKLNQTITIFDILAILSTLYCVVKLIMYGPGFFELGTLQKRAVLNGSISHYINLYVIVYSLFLTISYMFEKIKKNFVFKIRIINMVIYWLIFLTCERSVFVSFFIGFIMLFATKIKKVKLKHILLVSFTILMFLFSAALRENINFSTSKISNILYSSTTEYYCTFSITNAYLYDNDELQYGKTYIYDSISKLFPSFMLENKPKDLSQQFKEKHHLNVGFAFNPVAEGIMNFGKLGATIFVPLLMFFINQFAKKMGNKNVLYYIIIACYSLYYCRGAFSNFFFDILFCYIIIFGLYKLNYGKEYKNEKNRINNIS